MLSLKESCKHIGNTGPDFISTESDLCFAVHMSTLYISVNSQIELDEGDFI